MDELSLDGRLLQMFVLVYETMSVTEAAYRLDVTQSTVSHGLARLRKIVDDPLFVAAGRGITPTPHAHVLAKQAEGILMQLKQFATAERYEPLTDTGELTIAAYDYEIETIFKPVLPILRQQAPHLTFRVARAYGQDEWIQVLRENRADLVLTIALGDIESELERQILFTDEYACFYDANSRLAPNRFEDYVSAPHAIVTSDGRRPHEIDRGLKALGKARRILLEAPSFSAVATLMQGSDIVATLPSRLKDSLFSKFSCVEPPIDVSPLQFALVWHSRNTASARHQWFRNLINDTFHHLPQPLDAPKKSVSKCNF